MPMDSQVVIVVTRVTTVKARPGQNIRHLLGVKRRLLCSSGTRRSFSRFLLQRQSKRLRLRYRMEVRKFVAVESMVRAKNSGAEAGCSLKKRASRRICLRRAPQDRPLVKPQKRRCTPLETTRRHTRSIYHAPAMAL